MHAIVDATETPPAQTSLFEALSHPSAGDLGLTNSFAREMIECGSLVPMGFLLAPLLSVFSMPNVTFVHRLPMMFIPILIRLRPFAIFWVSVVGKEPVHLKALSLVSVVFDGCLQGT